MKFRMVMMLTVIAICGNAEAAEIRFQRDGTDVFVHAGDVARQLNLKLEVVQPGRLLTFCTIGNDAICIPVRLTAENHRGKRDSLMLSESLIESSLHATVTATDSQVSITMLPASDSQSLKIPAYNANWGPGRGFRPGQTVPDIPFIDLDGKEVRLSAFLGKRYILYCWASW